MTWISKDIEPSRQDRVDCLEWRRSAWVESRVRLSLRQRRETLESNTEHIKEPQGRRPHGPVCVASAGNRKPHVSTGVRVIRSTLWCVANYRWEQAGQCRGGGGRAREMLSRGARGINTLHREKSLGNKWSSHWLDASKLSSFRMLHAELWITWLWELRIQSHHFEEVLQNLLGRPRHYLVSGAAQRKTQPALISKH